MTRIEGAFREGFSRGISAGHDLAPKRDRDEDLQWNESDAKEACETGPVGCTVWVMVTHEPDKPNASLEVFANLPDAMSESFRFKVEGGWSAVHKAVIQ